MNSETMYLALRRGAAGLTLLALLVAPAVAQNGDPQPLRVTEVLAMGNTLRISSGTFLRADVMESRDWTRVPKNTMIEAHLQLPLYSGDQIALPAGSTLRLRVESAERVRDGGGFWTTARLGIVRAFNPLEKRRTPRYLVELSAAEIVLPGGGTVPVKASVLRAGYAVVVSTEPGTTQRKSSAAGNSAPGKPKAHHTLLLQLQGGIDLPFPAQGSSLSREPDSKPEAGTRARAFLLNELSASHSHEGDAFQAELAEPVRLGGRLFEAGSLLQGKIGWRTPPRILSRAGVLHLVVERLTSRQGETVALTGTLASAEADARTRFVLDDEGTLRGLKPGVTKAIVDLGIAYALGKLSDDIAETPIRAIGAGMSDAAVANAARYVGLGTSLVFLVMRRGRDVCLPKYGEIEVDFGRMSKEVTSGATAPPTKGDAP